MTWQTFQCIWITPYIRSVERLLALAATLAMATSSPKAMGSRLEDRINQLEKASGQDLDGDGDVGLPGRPLMAGAEQPAPVLTGGGSLRRVIDVRGALLGSIFAADNMRLSDLRSLIDEEVEHLPKEWRFEAGSNGPVSLKQESRDVGAQEIYSLGWLCRLGDQHYGHPDVVCIISSGPVDVILSSAQAEAAKSPPRTDVGFFPTNEAQQQVWLAAVSPQSKPPAFGSPGGIHAPASVHDGTVDGWHSAPPPSSLFVWNVGWAPQAPFASYGDFAKCATVAEAFAAAAEAAAAAELAAAEEAAAVASAAAAEAAEAAAQAAEVVRARRRKLASMREPASAFEGSPPHGTLLPEELPAHVAKLRDEVRAHETGAQSVNAPMRTLQRSGSWPTSTRELEQRMIANFELVIHETDRVTAENESMRASVQAMGQAMDRQPVNLALSPNSKEAAPPVIAPSRSAEARADAAPATDAGAAAVASAAAAAGADRDEWKPKAVEFAAVKFVAEVTSPEAAKANIAQATPASPLQTPGTALPLPPRRQAFAGATGVSSSSSDAPLPANAASPGMRVLADVTAPALLQGAPLPPSPTPFAPTPTHPQSPAQPLPVELPVQPPVQRPTYQVQFRDLAQIEQAALQADGASSGPASQLPSPRASSAPLSLTGQGSLGSGSDAPRSAARAQGGIGVQLDYSSSGDSVAVLAIQPGGPAAIAGLAVGDLILGVDGVPIAIGSTPEVIKAQIVGPLEEKLQLTVSRGGGEPMRVMLQREPAPTPVGAAQVAGRGGPLVANTAALGGGRATQPSAPGSIKAAAGRAPSPTSKKATGRLSSVIRAISPVRKRGS